MCGGPLSFEMNAHESLAADVALFHADPTGTGETVTLVPRTGDPVALRATVARTGMSLDEYPDGQWEVEVGQLYVAGTSANGITVDDAFTITPVGGGSAETWKIRHLGLYTSGVREILIVRQVRKAMIGQNEQYHRGRGRAIMGAS